MHNFLKIALRAVSRNLLVLVALGGMATVALAFTEPSVGPTGGTVYAPINTSTNSQTKLGGNLMLSGGGFLQAPSGTVLGSIVNAVGSLSLAGTSGITKIVSQITGPSGATTNGANVSFVNGGGLTQSGNTFTFTGGGGGTPGGAAGAVQFNSNPAGTFTGDAATLSWDNTNKRLAIGQGNASAKLTIRGSGDALFVASDAAGNIKTLIGSNGDFIIQGAKLTTDRLSVGAGFSDTVPTNGIISHGNVLIGASTQYDSTNRLEIEGPVGGGGIRVSNGWIKMGYSSNIAQLNSLPFRFTSTEPGIGMAFPTQESLFIGQTQANDTGVAMTCGSTCGRWALYKAANPFIPGTTEATWKVWGGAFNFITEPDTVIGGTADSRMYIANNGNVGIGTASPGYTLTVNGTAWVTSGTWSGSDIRWKKDIKPLEDSLSKLMQLQGVGFNWRKEEYPDLKFNDGSQIGFIAQDVEKVFPEVVTTNADGYKGISYEKLVPVLTESIKEQQKEIEELKAEIELLKAR